MSVWDLKDGYIYRCIWLVVAELVIRFQGVSIPGGPAQNFIDKRPTASNIVSAWCSDIKPLLPPFLFCSYQGHSVHLLNNEKMDSPTQDVFGRRQVNIAWGDMIIMEAWETKHLNGIKYTKYYDETGSMTTRAWILRLAPFLRSLYNEIAWSRRARHAILHNQINSPFHKLPVEILQAIAEYLPPVARLSLRRVCSKLRTCLTHLGPEIKSQSLWMAERYQFVFLLK